MEFDREVSLIMRDKETFDNNQETSPFFKNIIREGVVLYGWRSSQSGKSKTGTCKTMYYVCKKSRLKLKIIKELQIIPIMQFFILWGVFSHWTEKIFQNIPVLVRILGKLYKE